jgi:hypothetical protein
MSTRRKTTTRKKTGTRKTSGTTVSKSSAINQRTKKLKPGHRYLAGGRIVKVKTKK